MSANLITDDRQTARADAENAEGLGDPCAEAKGSHGRFPQDRRASQKAALDRSFSGGFDEVAEHHVSVLAAVVAPRPLVQVALKPLVRDRVMSATDACFEQAEEPVDGLRMHIPVYESMRDARLRVPGRLCPGVSGVPVAEEET